MSRDAISEWAKSFRADALKDDLSVFRQHMQRLDLPDSPELMLEGTIEMVGLCAVFCNLDRRENDFRKFLEIQTYDPMASKGAKYAYTFDIVGFTYARILVANTKSPLDLADLYGAPWNKYEVCGFSGLWVSHPDWSPMKEKELRALEQEITDDVYFDYGEDEVDVWLDEDSSDRYVRVFIEDQDDGEEID